MTVALSHEEVCAVHERIIGGIASDDPRMMKPLFDLYYAPLCGFARRYVGDVATAEEVVSDVITRIWQNRHSDYHAETFREYLFAAVRNTALNYISRRSRFVLVDQWTEQLRGELIDETPLDTMIHDELQATVNAAIEALPEQCRRAFKMSRFEDLTYDEIAEYMQISVNTVKLHIKTALGKLRKALAYPK